LPHYLKNAEKCFSTAIKAREKTYKIGLQQLLKVLRYLKYTIIKLIYPQIRNSGQALTG